MTSAGPLAGITEQEEIIKPVKVPLGKASASRRSRRNLKGAASIEDNSLVQISEEQKGDTPAKRQKFTISPRKASNKKTPKKLKSAQKTEATRIYLISSAEKDDK